MKLFTFGCSYTNYYWPTWSDLLGYQFDEHQNWAISGLGNNAIMQRVNEALTKNKVTEDDYVVVHEFVAAHHGKPVTHDRDRVTTHDTGGGLHSGDSKAAPQ